MERSHSLNCPSSNLPWMVLWIMSAMASGLWSVMERLVASMMSASMRIAVSLVCGLGPL